MDAFLPKFSPDTRGTLALVDTRLHEALDETLVALQALTLQADNGVVGYARFKACFFELSTQLVHRMLAASKQIHRLLARFFRVGKTIVLVRRDEVVDHFVD